MFTTNLEIGDLVKYFGLHNSSNPMMEIGIIVKTLDEIHPFVLVFWSGNIAGELEPCIIWEHYADLELIF